MDFRKRQTSTATPAEPGELSYFFSRGEVPSVAGQWRQRWPMSSTSLSPPSPIRWVRAVASPESRRRPTSALLAVLDDALNQALRAAQTVCRLRDFVSRGETVRRVESIASMIEDASNGSCQFRSAQRQSEISLRSGPATSSPTGSRSNWSSPISFAMRSTRWPGPRVASSPSRQLPSTWKGLRSRCPIGSGLSDYFSLHAPRRHKQPNRK